MRILTRCVYRGEGQTNMKKLSKRQVDDLLTMIEHTRRDLKYGEGGTFNDGKENIDSKDVRKVERAIDWIKVFILSN